MSEPKSLHLAAYLRPVSLHTAVWRYPGAFPDANFNLAHLVSFIKKLEEAKFDAFFMGDDLAVLNLPFEVLKRNDTVASFEPFTLLSAPSMVTERIGLAATASTTYEELYHIARRFASLNHLSNGRAAWNVVTTGNPECAKNFGLDERNIVTGLGDSFADDSFLYDQDSSIYFDPEKLHVLHHKGEEFKVKGLLNIARPVQSWPVIVQAGQSETGRKLAPETAEVVFCAPRTFNSAKELYGDVKSRTTATGRNAGQLKIIPSAFLIIGDTVEEAKAKRIKLDRLVNYDTAIASLSLALGTDASGFDPESLLPTDIPETNGSKSNRIAVLNIAEAERVTVRQLAQRCGGFGGLTFVGTAKTIADEWSTWMAEGPTDGFIVLFPYLQQGLDDVVEKLVLELQRRGMFRNDYEGRTLREQPGLPRPKNQFFSEKFCKKLSAA